MPLKQFFQTKLALGSDTTLVLVTDLDEVVTEKIFSRLWHKIFTFERSFSRFLPASELSSFNRQAGLKIKISDEFKALLTAAKALGQQTKGIFNPFLLPALQRSGYQQSFVQKYAHDEVDDFSNRRVASISELEIGDNWARIPFATAIDLGGCGKGYLADQLAAALPKQQVSGFWFSLGGDIIAGGQNQQGQAWTVHIQDAHDTGGKDIKYSVAGTKKQFAVATSGTTVRRGQKQGKTWHHILDPTTQQPAVTDILLATVHTDSALRADVLASCAVILGSARAPEFLHGHKVNSYVLQTGQGIKKFGSSLKLNEIGKYA